MSSNDPKRPGMGSVAMTVAGLLLAIAPFVIPRIPVGTDLLKHVLMAYILNHYHDPVLRYDHYFEVLWRARSTAVSELSLAALERVLPPFDALKAFLVLFVAVLWAASLRLTRYLGAPFTAALVFLPLAHTFCVFSGFLPYVVSIALFPFLLAGLMDPRRTPGRIAGFAAWLLLLYAFHIVGAAVGGLALAIYAVRREEGRWRIAWRDFAALAPIGALCVYYVLQKGSGKGVLHYFPLLTHLKSFWGYNVWTLSRLSGVLFLAAILALAAAVLVQLRRGRVLWQPALLAGLLIVIGSALPYQIDDWFVVGSRTLPFALIAAVVCLDLRRTGWHVATGAAMALLLVSSLENTRISLAVQPKYDDFLSGVAAIPYGSNVMPIIQDLALGGNQYINPFNGIEDVYTIERGGSNPYVLAMPRWVEPGDALPDPTVEVEAVGGEPNGAPILRYRDPPLYAYKFSKGGNGFQGTNYRGAGKLYDYFIVYGQVPAVMPAIEAQAKLVYTRGDLRIYESLRHAAGR
ncbi:MAG TPA: hypothetical protein VGS58_00245 [Candidatus Sulfopaludibacter sp.]|nr:hypothetical protein [Candidatus Sulfopaludibacter sp.]